MTFQETSYTPRDEGGDGDSSWSIRPLLKIKLGKRNRKQKKKETSPRSRKREDSSGYGLRE